jgi:hypothetical protein
MTFVTSDACKLQCHGPDTSDTWGHQIQPSHSDCKRQPRGFIDGMELLRKQATNTYPISKTLFPATTPSPRLGPRQAVTPARTVTAPPLPSPDLQELLRALPGQRPRGSPELHPPSHLRTAPPSHSLFCSEPGDRGETRSPNTNLVTFSPVVMTRPAQSEHGMPVERTGQGFVL